jgi:hypothetical protein
MEKSSISRTIILYCVMFALVAGALMLVWNSVMPGLFGNPELDYWHSMGLLLISRILFGGEGFYFKRKFDQCFSSQWKERLDSMSPDEREILKKKWEERCGKLND